MSKTYLGYYGMQNLGDDLMLKTLLESSTNEKINVIQFKNNPLPDQNGNVTFLTWPEGKLAKVLFAIKFILRSKELIFGGGTCFTDEDGDGFFKYMVIGKLLGRKVKYRAIGVGNLKRNSRILKTKILLNIADEITVRDEQSLIRVKKILGKNKRQIFKEDDLAIKSILNIISKEKFRKNSEEPYIALGWRNLERYNCNEWNNPSHVVEYILKLSKDKGLNKVIMFDVDSHFDCDINRTLFNLLKKTHLDVVYNKSTDIIEKMKIICESSFVFTSRLHVAVIAEIANVPCEALNYSPKIRYFVDEVKSQYVKVVECT